MRAVNFWEDATTAAERQNVDYVVMTYTSSDCMHVYVVKIYAPELECFRTTKE